MYQTTTSCVSIIIPCYKQAQYLKESVGAVLSQTHKNWEIVIVDDGSPDDCAAIAQQLINQNLDKKIRLVRKLNGGLADARNAGIAASTSGWILPLDCDDVIDATFLQKAFQLIESVPSSNLVYANLQQFGAKHDPWIPGDYTLPVLMGKNLFPYASMFKKELWVRSGGYERSLPWGCEDYSFWLSCGKLGLRPMRIWEPLFRYRVAQESMFTKLIAHWTHVESMMHTLHPDLYPSKLLMAEHEIIGTMDDETFALLKKKTELFPELAHPHLWMGFRYEKDKQFDAAIDSYRLFAKLHCTPDWQGLWRELVCRVKCGDALGAKMVYEELKTFFPEILWIRDAWTAMTGESQTL